MSTPAVSYGQTAIRASENGCIVLVGATDPHTAVAAGMEKGANVPSGITGYDHGLLTPYTS